MLLGVRVRVGVEHGDQVLVGGGRLVPRMQLDEAGAEVSFAGVRAEREVAQVPLVDDERGVGVAMVGEPAAEAD